MFQFSDHIAQKIEMLFSDSDIAEMSQYKNYSEMMNAKACHNMQDIILDFTFEETRRLTHFCKQIVNFNIERLAKEYKPYTPKQTWRPDMFWKTECAVCRKEFHNLGNKTTEYGTEDPTQADFTDEWEWYGDVCHKCDERYNIREFYDCDEDRFINFMHRLCEGETKAERDEIFKNYDDFPSDYEDY